MQPESASGPDATQRPGSEERPVRVAIIGSGPSGFYAAGALLKADPVVEVDVFDRLPTPFGLVRGGVAPDHQKIKNVIRVYNKTAEHERFRFLGNVMVGRDLSVDDLLRHYDQIVYAVGNESDRSMNVPGEELEGVHSATEFVGWYNGHPDFQDRSFALDRARRVAVVGNGNVAMDVARVLSQDLDVLAETDITDGALDALRASTIEEIVILGRRGPAQAAFSPKEIKELGELEHAELVVEPAEARLDPLSAEWLESAAPSARKNVEYLLEKSAETPSGSPAKRRICCRFLVSPTEFLGEGGKLTAVRIERNELTADRDGTPRPRGTGEHETLEVDLVFKAVGYRGVPLQGVPFHERWGIFPNDEGRITDGPGGPVVPRQYVVGWAKRGPSGLIGTNGPDSQATVAKMLEDVPALGEGAPEPSREAVDALLSRRGVDVVTFEDWQRLDEDELARGSERGKVRDKYLSVDEMVEAVRRLRSQAGVA
ncbi:MAG: NADP oxidoreductase [Acidobacteria bacterium]|nr:MAG: NADP oxidoreductase [Acidobacteriota bacterium]REK05930.1 MAG: NADP oxidoreductase [Acidobacteriota bacterium]